MKIKNLAAAIDIALAGPGNDSAYIKFDGAEFVYFTNGGDTVADNIESDFLVVWRVADWSNTDYRAGDGAEIAEQCIDGIMSRWNEFVAEQSENEK